jgi:uncharacterized 2Fe-2S/4Fe-4S cluster protein (DUF4445 family)
VRKSREPRAKAVFYPSGRTAEDAAGRTILDVAKGIGENIESICGGRGACGKCKVRVSSGPSTKFCLDSSPDRLSPIRDPEVQLLTEEEQRGGFRLACCALIQGDVLIEVPEESRAAKYATDKRPAEITVRYKPAVRQYHLALPPPTLDDPKADLERVLGVLEEGYGLKGLRCDLEVLRTLPNCCRAHAWEVTVTVWMNKEIIRVMPGKGSHSYGLAVDLGTTTMAASLVHMESMRVMATETLVNPQVQFGEDVMSRIAYASRHPDALREMGRMTVAGLNSLIESLLMRAVGSQEAPSEVCDEPLATKGGGVIRGPLGPEEIEDMVLVGNTVMQHILLAVDPSHLGVAPFPPAFHQSLDVKAREFGIRISPSAYVHLLPNEAGFVGADNVAVLIVETPHKKDQIQLIIDIGTNAEVVLGNRKRLIATSCATGPAFEGAHITFGTRAAPGAIERLHIDPKTREVNYKVVGSDLWSEHSRPGELRVRGICGSGIMDLFAELYRAGIITHSGAFQEGLRSRRFRINPETGEAEFVIAWAEETAIGGDVTISQKDIRQIQLAKAAVYTGCKILMRRMGVERVDLVKIAGSFGLHVDPAKALIMGMIPDCDPQKVVAVGNAAGAGAIAALLNLDKRVEANRVARNVEYLELASQKDFKERFLEALDIPHRVDPFPRLEAFLRPLEVPRRGGVRSAGAKGG